MSGFPAADLGLPKRRIESRQIFSSPWMSLRDDTVETEHSGTQQFAVVSRLDFVVILCDLGEHDTAYLMVEQFRYATQQWSLEFPQGSVEAGESPTEAAVREVREETGLLATRAELLATGLHEAGDWATQSFSIVWIDGDKFVGQSLDSSETSLSVKIVPSEAINGLVQARSITDAATLASLYFARTKRRGN